MVILVEVSFSETINNPGNKRSRTSSNTWVSRRSGLDGFKGTWCHSLLLILRSSFDSPTAMAWRKREGKKELGISPR